MSNLSFENIDQWFFEYTEGNLSSAQESQFLDFIGEYPELLQELKAWKGAKVTPLTTHEPSTAELVKSPWFLSRPTLLVATGVLALLLGWIGISYIPSQKQYTKSKIDAEIIDVHLVKGGGAFTKQALASHQSESKANKTKIIQDNKTVSSATNSTKPSTRQESDSDIANTNKGTFTNQNKSNKLDKKEDIQNNTSTVDHPGQYSKQHHIQSKTQDLDTIIAYLNGRDDNYKSQSNIDGQIAYNNLNSKTEKTKTRSSTSRSSSKVTFKRLVRKITRMMEQPTALKNTKTPNYHVPMMTGFKANPAMVGTASGSRIQATSRIQWLNQPNAQLMNTLSYDSYVSALRGGIGIDLNYDGYNINALNNYSVGLTYSPKIFLSKSVSIEPAFRFKMGVVNIDQSSDVVGNEIEMNRNNITPLFVNEPQLNANQMWYRDVGVGLMFNTNWFYAGFNADNLGRHDNNFYSSNMNKKHRDNIFYTAVVGTEYEAITRDMSVSAYGLFQNYGDLKELWLGANFKYKWMQFGAGVNTKADFGASAGLVFDHVTFHYNVDYTESELLQGKYLSHQISLGILLKPKRNTVKYMNL